MTAPPSPSDARVPSPCVRNCCLDVDNVCMGCGRALEEIVGWSGANDDERLEILERSRERMILRAADRRSG